MNAALAPTGLPDYREGTSGHSVSNHQRVDRGSPGCQRIDARPDRLRPSVEDSPIHADRIEFTATVSPNRLCYGLVVLVPLLSTSCCHDAVTVRYRTILHRTEADSHRSIPSPSQAHDRARLGRSRRRPRRRNSTSGPSVGPPPGPESSAGRRRRRPRTAALPRCPSLAPMVGV